MGNELKVKTIENGTVIDHMPAGTALSVAGLLELDASLPLIIAMNVDSSRHGKKDMIKVENKFLSKGETDKISLIAPTATINIIMSGKVGDKRRVSPPKELRNIVECPNKKCVTNSEDCGTRFIKNGEKYKCRFCETQFKIDDFSIS